MNEREEKLNDLLDSLNDKLDKALALKANKWLDTEYKKPEENIDEKED